MNLREAAQQALEALESLFTLQMDYVLLEQREDAISALRAALAQPERAQAMRDAGYTRRPTLREMADPEQPEQEPVAWIESPHGTIRANPLYRINAPQSVAWSIPLYTALPRREWQSLTDEEIDMIYAQPQTHKGQYARAIEAALKEKNA